MPMLFTDGEAEVYRRALVRLYCLATDGKRRKTIDKATVAEIAGPAIDEGNQLHRLAKLKRTNGS